MDTSILEGSINVRGSPTGQRDTDCVLGGGLRLSGRHVKIFQTILTTVRFTCWQTEFK